MRRTPQGLGVVIDAAGLPAVLFGSILVDDPAGRSEGFKCLQILLDIM